MASDPSTTRAVVKGLLNLIQTRMPSIAQAYDDFPSPNQTLQYPSFSIFTQEPKFTPVQPYVVKKLTKITDEEDPDFGKTPVLYCIGKDSFKMQVDFWCENKFQRHDIREEFIKAFNDLSPTSGINLKLTDYYDEWIHAFFGTTSFNSDSEISSQRGEWRLIVDVTTEIKVIKKKMEYIMETFEQEIETTEEDLVDNSAGSDYTGETI